MKLFIYCAGGFGREIFDIAKRVNKIESQWNEIFFIDDNPCLGCEFYNTKLFTFDKVLQEFDLKDIEVLIASGEPSIRKIIYDKLKLNDIRLATLVDNTAIVSETAKLDEGVIVTSHCSVASLARVGINVALNVKTIVGHDVKIGEHCGISSFVNLGGACSVGAYSYIGMGVQIKENVVIGKDVIVGMGSVVHHDIPDDVIVLGNPARPMRKNVDKKVFKNQNKGDFNDQ